MKTHIISFAALALGAACQVYAAPSVPIVLGKPNLSTYVSQISESPDGMMCITGHSMDPDGDLLSRGFLIVYSVATNRVQWRQDLAAPDDNANSRFVGCRIYGKDVYVVANVDTHSQPSLNQGLVWVYRFGLGGKLLAQRALSIDAFNSFAYDIDADADGVTVSGRTAGRSEESQTNAVIFVHLDPALKTEAMSRLATGAFVDGAVVRLSGNTATFGGNFAPAHAEADAVVDDYAVSKIVAGKYRFSVRPQTGSAHDIATGVTSAGEIISLGYTANTTHLTVVGPDGKVKVDRQFASAFCKTRSVSVDSDVIYAVRSACGNSKEPAQVVALNRKTNAEAVIGGIAGVPQYVLALADRLIVISRKSNGSRLLQTVAKGQ
jgi:hypothetical protein